MGKLIHKIIKSNPPIKKYGFLPKIATASKGSIGACLESIFCERVNSVANQPVTEGNIF